MDRSPRRNGSGLARCCGAFLFFHAAGLTKQIIAHAAFVLRDSGKLDFDRPLISYVDDLPDSKARTVTIRHVPSHSSGLPNWRLPGARCGSRRWIESAARRSNVKCDPSGNRDMTRPAHTGGAVDLPVIDATRLSGTESVCLGFGPGKPSADTSMLDSDMFQTVREQLGLYFAPEKAPVQVLVVDHIGHATPN